MLFILGTALLSLLDLYVTNKRIKLYGYLVELNPLARQLAKDNGAQAAIAFLLLWNTALIAVASQYPTALHVLFGAKLALGAFQLRSLETESFVETVLRAARKRKDNVPPPKPPMQDQ